MRKHTPAALVAAALLIVPRHLGATPSGLNNIPTADTTPDKTVVVQAFTTDGSGLDADLTMGFKAGFDPFKSRVMLPRFEFGLDGHILPHEAGPLSGNVKVAVPFGEHLPTLGIGVANILFSSEDRSRGGQPFSYAVLTEDFGPFRGHAGYGIQHRGNTVLLGLDKTIKVFGNDLTLRTDLIQTESQHNWLGSVGFLYAFCKYFAFEWWVNEPFYRGHVSFTSKVDFVIPFKKHLLYHVRRFPFFTPRFFEIRGTRRCDARHRRARNHRSARGQRRSLSKNLARAERLRFYKTIRRPAARRDRR